MAGIAIHYGVRTHQGKTVLVLIDVVDGNLPAIGVVTQFALRAILAAMKVGVAVLAFVRCIGKFQIAMTVSARHFSVAAAERKSGLHVVELDLAWNHLPVRRRMTRSAWEFEIPVRALCRGKRPHRLCVRGPYRQEQHDQKNK